MTAFIDRVLRCSENGYKGYKFVVKQVAAPPEEAADDGGTENAKAVNDDSRKVWLEIQLDHLDWKSLREEESAETFTSYKKSLGLFLAISNT